MSIVRAINNALTAKDQRNWDTLYVLLDIHGTVMRPNWSGLSTEFYPHALDVLRHMSKDPLYCIILWSCSKDEDKQYYKNLLISKGVNIKYVNENPEVKGRLDWGDYDSKLYCSIGMDDKFGFSGDDDWIEIKKFYNLPLNCSDEGK